MGALAFKPPNSTQLSFEERNFLTKMTTIQTWVAVLLFVSYATAGTTEKGSDIIVTNLAEDSDASDQTKMALSSSRKAEVAKKVDAKTEEKELNAKTKLAAKKVDAKTEEKELNAKTNLARLFKVEKRADDQTARRQNDCKNVGEHCEYNAQCCGEQGCLGQDRYRRCSYDCAKVGEPCRSHHQCCGRLLCTGGLWVHEDGNTCVD